MFSRISSIILITMPLIFRGWNESNFICELLFEIIKKETFNLHCKQLTNGDLKRVESLSTEDFIRSAKSSPEVKIDQSTVTAIEPCNERGTVMITFSVGKDNVKVGYTGP